MRERGPLFATRPGRRGGFRVRLGAMTPVDILLHIRDDSVKQKDQAGGRRNVYRREPPEKVIVRSKAERNNPSHNPGGSPLGNSGVSGSGGEIGEKDEGHLHLKDFPRVGLLDSKKTDTEIGEENPGNQEGQAQNANGQEA
jgi:hypothetical protein